MKSLLFPRAICMLYHHSSLSSVSDHMQYEMLEYVFSKPVVQAVAHLPTEDANVELSRDLFFVYSGSHPTHSGSHCFTLSRCIGAVNYLWSIARHLYFSFLAWGVSTPFLTSPLIAILSVSREFNTREKRSWTTWQSCSSPSPRNHTLLPSTSSPLSLSCFYYEELQLVSYAISFALNLFKSQSSVAGQNRSDHHRCKQLSYGESGGPSFSFDLQRA